MSDNGATQFCTHTTDGSICDRCMGRTKGPEPWKKFPFPVIGGDNMWETYYLAAPVEAAMREVKQTLSAILAADERGQGLPFYEAMQQAHRLLKNWPVKEGA